MLPTNICIPSISSPLTSSDDYESLSSVSLVHTRRLARVQAVRGGGSKALQRGAAIPVPEPQKSTLEGRERREHSTENQAAEPIKVGREEEERKRKEGWAKAGGTGGE